MGDINIAYNKIIQACNDPNIGYNQYDGDRPNRTTITLGVNYMTCCDCSSLISWALTEAGFFAQNPWFFTQTEPEYLIQAGFTRYPAGSVEWEAGDIVWIRNSEHQHTEMVYQGNGIGGITMGAHQRLKGNFAGEVSINSSPSSAGRYESIFKIGQSATVQNIEWIQSPSNAPAYLSESDQRNNAILINAYLSKHGYSQSAVAGILANWQDESTMNPNIWQDLTVGTGAYGLAQFDPASKYRDWAQQKGYSFDDANVNGNGQLEWIVDMPAGEWLPSVTHPEYNMSYDEFKVIQNDPEKACKAWLWQFERAGTEHLAKRIQNAYYWFNEIPNFPSDVGNPPPTIKAGFVDWELRRRLVKPF